MKDQHYEEAKNYYVTNGFSMDTITKLMSGKVSRKTLYNWKKDNNWDEDRKREMRKTENLKDDIYELARQAVEEAKTNPSPANFFAVGKMINVLKSVTVITAMEAPPEDTEKKPKTVTAETIQKIEALLGL